MKISKYFLILAFILCSGIWAGAQTPFEKNGKWGLKDSVTGKTIVSIYTVGGRKIASKFFPYGTRKNVIIQFGKQYLYQSY
ncbi:MAG: hypothetical protein K2H18_03535 [Muribaculaceae bacterium]|nr:hypothetical protein [Muribaculaceae bacterium]